MNRHGLSGSASKPYISGATITHPPLDRHMRAAVRNHRFGMLFQRCEAGSQHESRQEKKANQQQFLYSQNLWSDAECTGMIRERSASLPNRGPRHSAGVTVDWFRSVKGWEHVSRSSFEGWIDRAKPTRACCSFPEPPLIVRAP